jgi:tetratricopeptide (TPR) repeat protein
LLQLRDRLRRKTDAGEEETVGDQPLRQRASREDLQGEPKSTKLTRSRSMLVLGAVALIGLAVVASPRDESVQAKLEQGVAAHNAGNTDRAEQLYREVLRQNPGNAVANFNLGVAAQQENRLPEAAAYYQKALDKEPDFIAARYNYAILKERQSDYGVAEQFYREILENHPDQVKARINLGFLLVNKLNRRTEGIEEFRKALEVDPKLVSRIPPDLRPAAPPAPAPPQL